MNIASPRLDDTTSTIAQKSIYNLLEKLYNNNYRKNKITPDQHIKLGTEFSSLIQKINTLDHKQEDSHEVVQSILGESYYEIEYKQYNMSLIWNLRCKDCNNICYTKSDPSFIIDGKFDTTDASSDNNIYYIENIFKGYSTKNDYSIDEEHLDNKNLYSADAKIQYLTNNNFDGANIPLEYVEKHNIKKVLLPPEDKIEPCFQTQFPPLKNIIKTEYITFDTAPPYFIIYFARNSYDRTTGKQTKLNYKIYFNENIQQIFTIFIKSYLYELDSIISHKSSIVSCGHYVNYSKIDGKWWLFNDDTVSPEDNIETSIETSDIYMMLYKKKDDQLCINTSIPQLKLCQFGVLGFNQNKEIDVTSLLDFSQIIVVDPAGLDIKNKEKLFQAGFASGEIYKWVKEVDTNRNTFPSDVQNNIINTGYAVYYEYAPNRRIIHVVGPCADTSYENYYKPEYAQETDFTNILTKAYTNVLDAFISISDYKSFTLHLLPISGDAFAGPHKNKISIITFNILTKLLNNDKYKDKDINIRFCMFTQKEYDAFHSTFVSS